MMLGYLAILGMLCGAADDPLVGMQIRLDTGDSARRAVPISVPYTGLAKGRYVAQEQGTAKDMPVTIRNDELTFVAEGGAPHTEHVYVLRAIGPETAPHVVVEKVPDKNAVEVRIDDKLLTAYRYEADAPKPCLWPLLFSDGTAVTRDFPLGPKDQTDDHPHHRSLWTGHGDVNGVDFWGEEKGAGTQRVERVDFGSGDAYGWLRSENVWQAPDQKPVIQETREYRFYSGPERLRLIDVTIDFTAKYGDVAFGDTKEAGIIALRVRDGMTERAGAKILNAEGLQGEKACWGKPSAWCDYAESQGEAGERGVAIFDRPGNLRYPTPWHVRDYGLLAANCFALSAYAGKDAAPNQGRYVLKNGETLKFQYRIVVHEGKADRVKLADRYADCAAPPKALLEKAP